MCLQQCLGQISLLLSSVSLFVHVQLQICVCTHACVCVCVCIMRWCERLSVSVSICVYSCVCRCVWVCIFLCLTSHFLSSPGCSERRGAGRAHEGAREEEEGDGAGGGTGEEAARGGSWTVPLRTPTAAAAVTLSFSPP